MKAIPVLRWAGSKRKILTELRQNMPNHIDRYIEPFAGSAVLFFDAKPKLATIGDINPEVTSTYQAIKTEPEEVTKFLESIPRSQEAYYELRKIDPTGLTPAQRAARLIFLMKSCFNGVYRTNKSGAFNVPFGGKIYAIPESKDILRASALLKNTTIILGDFKKSIASAKSGDFVYLDPPYSDSIRFRGEYGYEGSFLSDEMDRLINACKELDSKGVKVLLSFKQCEKICESLAGWNIKKFEVARSVAGFTDSRRKAAEILASNYD